MSTALAPNGQSSAHVVDLDREPEAMREQAPDLIAAEVSQQIATARAFPRSIEAFSRRLLTQATLNQEIAAACIYALPRAGKKIEGPSIRFAELVLATWGNCRAQARVVAELDNFVVAQGIFMDLEANMAVAEDTQRRIVDSEGRRYGLDMIGTTANAARSIALRNAILRGVPKALWWSGYIAARKTIIGDLRTIADKRKSAIEAFAVHAITDKQIFKALGVEGLADIGAEQLVTLAGFLSAIQNEESDPEELFPPDETKKAKKKGPTPPADKEGGDAARGAPPKETTADEGKGKGQSAPASSPPAHNLERVADASKAAREGQGDLLGETETDLEKSVRAMLPDCRSVADVEGLRDGMFRDDINAADAHVRARVDLMLNQRIEQLQKALG